MYQSKKGSENKHILASTMLNIGNNGDTNKKYHVILKEM